MNTDRDKEIARRFAMERMSRGDLARDFRISRARVDQILVKELGGREKVSDLTRRNHPNGGGMKTIMQELMIQDSVMQRAFRTQRRALLLGYISPVRPGSLLLKSPSGLEAVCEVEEIVIKRASALKDEEAFLASFESTADAVRALSDSMRSMDRPEMPSDAVISVIKHGPLDFREIMAVA